LIHNVVMPRLGLTMEEGSVVSWKKHLGDYIEKGEVLFTVETDKVEMEVESGDSGYLNAIHVQLGQKVPVGALIAIIGDRLGDPAVEELSHTGAAPHAQEPSTPASKSLREDGSSASINAGAEVSAVLPTVKIPASPRARRLAEELGIDITTVKPAHGQRVVEEDVRRFQASRDAISGSQGETQSHI
jgi:pyruvate dehydrogenase E2 component (dihydrolipoamide acetyltransferase)